MLDETGAEELLRAVVLQAARDLKRRNTPACYRRDAAQFLEFLGISDKYFQEVNYGKHDDRRTTEDGRLSA